MYKNVLKNLTNINSLCIPIFWGIFLSLLTCVAVSRLFFPMDSGNYESVVWSPAELAINGQNPYSYAFTEPYVMAPYGYFYYLVVGLGIEFLGTQFWFARLCSLLATFVICINIVKISKVFEANKIFSAIAVIFFLSSIPLLIMYAVQRPDLLALACVTSGLQIILQEFNRTSKDISQSYASSFLVVLASLLCFSAVFFKQTFFITAIFTGLWILLKREVKATLLFFCTGVVFSGFIVFVLTYTSDGGYIWQHFILTRQIPASYSQSILVTKNVLVSLSTIAGLLVIVFGIIKLIQEKLILQTYYIFFLFYFLLAVTIGFITSARAGAASNYYLESAFAASILIAILIGRIKETNFYPVLLMFFLFSGAFQLSRNLRGEYFRWQSYPYYAEIINTLNKTTPKDAVCISVYADLVSASGRAYHFGDWIQYTDGRSLELKELIIKKIESNQYKAIIWLTPEHNLLLKNGYKMIPMSTAVPEGNYPVYLYVLGKQP